MAFEQKLFPTPILNSYFFFPYQTAGHPQDNLKKFKFGSSSRKLVCESKGSPGLTFKALKNCLLNFLSSDLYFFGAYNLEIVWLPWWLYLFCLSMDGFYVEEIRPGFHFQIRFSLSERSLQQHNTSYEAGYSPNLDLFFVTSEQWSWFTLSSYSFT